MVAYDTQLTWRHFMTVMKAEFAELLERRTRDCWYEFMVNEECPTVCDSMDYSCPTTLAHVEVTGRAWWNLWKGITYRWPLLVLHKDWGEGFRTSVCPRGDWADRLIPMLRNVERATGITFKIINGKELKQCPTLSST